MTSMVRIPLVEARQQRGWSQQDVGERIGTTQNTVSRWERGIITPTPYFREKLSALFGKSAEELGITKKDVLPLPSKNETLKDISAPIFLSQEAPIWTIPYQRNPFFTGREKLLHFIHTVCTQHNKNNVAHPYALSGLGGIGKTQIAIEYAYRYAQDYRAVLWIQAETIETFMSSIGTIAQALKIVEAHSQNQRQITEAVLHWLRTHQQWLLLLDNVEDIEIVKNIFPLARAGAVLLTTRRQLLQPHAQNITIGKMSREEGVTFLMRRAHVLPSISLERIESQEEHNAHIIVEAMDGLPLALDQAGAYIYECRCRFAEYVLLLNDHSFGLLNTRDTHLDHPQSVVQTFVQAFVRLQRVNMHAASLLTVCSFLAPDAISKMMLLEGSAYLGPEFQMITTDHLFFHQAVKDLLLYSLIQYHLENQTISLHRITQMVLRTLLPPERQREWNQRIVVMLDAAFPSERLDVHLWQQKELVLPHALHCLKEEELWHDFEPHLFSLLQKTASYLIDRGRYTEAEILYQRALSCLSQTSITSYKEYILIQNDLAYLLLLQDRFSEAEQEYDQSKGFQHFRGMSNEFPYIQTLHGLGMVYCAQGYYGKAEEVFSEALSIWERLPSLSPLDGARILNVLANLAWQEKNMEEAEHFLQRAITLREKTLEPDHPDIAFNLHVLKQLYHFCGKVKEAEKIQIRLEAIKVKFQERTAKGYKQVLQDATAFYRLQTKQMASDFFLQQALESWERFVKSGDETD